MAQRDTEQLIGRLAAEVRPVRRLASPLRRAALWLGFAVAVITALVVLMADHADLAYTLGRTDALIGWVASLLTGAAAAVAAFHLALPDRSNRWALLPLPTAALWLAAMGAGCYIDWLRLGSNGLALGTSFSCLGFIVLVSLLLGVPMLLLVRHGLPVRPAATAAIGGLAVASLASAGLELFHHLDTRIMVLVWHSGAIVLVEPARLSRRRNRVAGVSL